MQEQILDALRRGAHDEALALAREGVNAEPTEANAHRLLAMALQASGDRESALASVDLAIALAPEDADLHFLRAGYLLGEQDVAAAQSALAQSVQLDPNQFGAYVMQAQLALGRGEIDEAERIGRLAARIAPDHPWTMMIEGSAASRRGHADQALPLLTKAAELAPDDAQVRFALGFAYLKEGHVAFAEQAFRGVLEKAPHASGLRMLLADLLRRQGRHADGAEELAPLLAAAETATPAVQRFAGELELQAGRHDRALPLLRNALTAWPADPRTLAALVEVWQRTGDRDDARDALDAALATSPQVIDLWRTRLMLEPIEGDAALAVADRWLAAVPDGLPALETKMALLAMRGDSDGVETVARRVVELQPGHVAAETQIVNLLLQRDPRSAVAHIEALLAESQAEDGKYLLRNWLGIAQDRAGMREQAVTTWSELHAEIAAHRLPLPEPGLPRSSWPELGDATAEAPAVAFLVGMPGSGVERLADVLSLGVRAFRGDRFGANPPGDLLQNYFTVAKMGSGELEAEAVAQDWRDNLPLRGVSNGEVVDWLLWWDNALLTVLRAHLPQADLLIALRDPRDMLLDWLAFGTPAQFRVASPKAAAGWLAIQLNQIALLHEQALFAHHLLRLDDIVDDGDALAKVLGEALQTPIPPPPPGVLGQPRFPAGHWREYAGALAEPFALLANVARRLGYPDA